jgi:4-hydroxythreonine-4-phosphate dehydrogenase
LNNQDKQIVIAITMGDPAGIGPEIIVKALNDPFIRRMAKFVIFGMNEQLVYAADSAEIEPYWVRHPYEKISRDYPRNVVVADYDIYSLPAWVKEPNTVSGQSSMHFCKDAVRACLNGIFDAVVTAPINKESWQMAGGKWPGHTEMLADMCKSPRKSMMFVAKNLRLALASIHEPLFDLRHKFTIGMVFEPIDLLNDALKKYFGIESPRIAVAGLNPHAGENGQFGDEEQRVIRPAIMMANEVGIKCSGPYPADSMFIMAIDGKFDGVVAMYHDQGMIPVKLYARSQAVNVTIGLPIIRTSPAHGTAFDIAGKGIADPDSMKEAIKLAVEMAKIKKGIGGKINAD